MNVKQEKNHIVDVLFVLALFVVFTLSAPTPNTATLASRSLRIPSPPSSIRVRENSCSFFSSNRFPIPSGRLTCAEQFIVLF